MQPLGSLREAQGVTQAAVCEVVQNPADDGNYHRRSRSHCEPGGENKRFRLGVYTSGSPVEL